MLSTQECKAILRRLGDRFNVSPKAIATRLLSDDDKKDMREGLLPIDALALHIELWKTSEMPDYAHGKTELNEPQEPEEPQADEKLPRGMCECGYLKPICICPDKHPIFGNRISPENVDKS